MERPGAHVELERREKDELRVAVSVYKAQRHCDARLQAILGAKVQLLSTKAEMEKRAQEEEAGTVQAQQARMIAMLECDLAKSKVDLHRWRQRTALLKVQLTSAQEDVDRYHRMADIFFRQFELELAAKRGMAGQLDEQRERLAGMQAHMQQQAEVLAALQAEARQLQGIVASRDDQLAQMQKNLQLNGEEQAAALAAEQAKCLRLHEQLVAVEERARLTEAALAAEQSRAQQADTALQQERAMFAANQSLHTGLTSMAQMMDSGMQAQLRDVQEQLREKERLEREAQERLREEERRSRELVQRCERLEGKLERRTQHLASLQQAMQQPDDGTPARGVAAVLNSVGELTEQLGGGLTPETELRLHKPVLSQPQRGVGTQAVPVAPGAAAAKGHHPAELQVPGPAPAAAAFSKAKPRRKAAAATQPVAAANKAQHNGSAGQAAQPGDVAQQPAQQPKRREQGAKAPSAAVAQPAAVNVAGGGGKKRGAAERGSQKEQRQPAKPVEESDDGWSDEGDAEFQPGRAAGAARKPPAKKRAKAAAAAASGAQPAAAGGAAEPVAGAGGRPVRQRNHAAPYWMGPAAGAQPAAEQQQSEPELKHPSEGSKKGEERTALKGSSGSRNGTVAQAAGQEEPRSPLADRGEEQAAKVLQQLSGGATEPLGTARKSKRPGAAAAVEEEEEGIRAAPKQEAQARNGTRPAKRPFSAATEEHDAAQNTAPGAENERKRPAPGKSRLGQQAREAAAAPAAARSAQGVQEQENTAGAMQGGRAGGTQPASQQQQGCLPEQERQKEKPYRSKLEDNPLDALNKNVLAAAERLVLPHRLGAAGGLPLKSSLQNALAKRSLGSSGGSQEQQPGRRKLLSVSTSYVVGADSLPSGSLFGFKKLSTGKPN